MYRNMKYLYFKGAPCKLLLNQTRAFLNYSKWRGFKEYSSFAEIKLKSRYWPNVNKLSSYHKYEHKHVLSGLIASATIIQYRYHLTGKVYTNHSNNNCYCQVNRLDKAGVR